MKKFYSFILSIITATIAHTQVEITTNTLPQADDTLITQNAALLVEVDLEVTGADVTWDFGPEVLMTMGTNINTICYDVDDTPIAYQFLFNNPFDPEHNSDFGIGIEPIELGTFTFEDAYQYYQNNSSKYAITGMGVSISGLPIAAQANDTDVIYDLPLNFNDSGNSNTYMEFDIPEIGFWGSSQQREYLVDGWGTLLINDLSIDVLRYRTVLNGTDSIYSDLFQFGTTFPRPETIEYRWLSPQYKVPVLQITTQGGFVTSVLTAEIFETSSVSENDQNFSIYPNPTSGSITIQTENTTAAYSILSMDGKLMESNSIGSGVRNIDVSNYPTGVYVVRMETNGNVQYARFIKQ